MRTTPEGIYSVQGAQFQEVALPQIKEVRGKDYMFYGELNLFPQQLIGLYDTSASLFSSAGVLV